MVIFLVMKLETYLRQNKIATATFAAAIEVSVQALHRYLYGARFPRREVLERILSVTMGAVTPNDFFDIEQTRPIRRYRTAETRDTIPQDCSAA